MHSYATGGLITADELTHVTIGGHGCHHVPAPTIPVEHPGQPTTTLAVFVPGKPAPQGSKRYLGAGRPLIESSKAVAPWRADIRTEVQHHRGDQPPLTGALIVELEFVLPRPTSLPKRKATPRHTKRPDLDKLARAVLDALKSAGAYDDDSQVDDLGATKRYAEIGEKTGCHIRITTARPA